MVVSYTKDHWTRTGSRGFQCIIVQCSKDFLIFRARFRDWGLLYGTHSPRSATRRQRAVVSATVHTSRRLGFVRGRRSRVSSCSRWGRHRNSKLWSQISFLLVHRRRRHDTPRSSSCHASWSTHRYCPGDKHKEHFFCYEVMFSRLILSFLLLNCRETGPLLCGVPDMNLAWTCHHGPAKVVRLHEFLHKNVSIPSPQMEFILVSSTHTSQGHYSPIGVEQRINLSFKPSSFCHISCSELGTNGLWCLSHLPLRCVDDVGPRPRR